MTTDKAMTAEVAAKVLAAAASGGQVVLDLSGASCCPSALTPIVAVADFYRMRGIDIRLDAPDGTTVHRAIAGFLSGNLSPDLQSPFVNSFDRVWRYSS